jgi:Tfp pilus assembly protein PilF
VLPWLPRLRLVVGLLAAVAALGLAASFGGGALAAWYHNAAGERALLRRDFGAALAHAEAGLRLKPDSGRGRLLAVRAARRSGDLDAAERHLAACAGLPGVEDDVTLEWALLRARRGHFAEVEPYLRSRLDEDAAQAVPILEVLCAELIRTLRLQEASAFLDRWLELAPDDPEVRVCRGLAAERRIDMEAAAAEYEKALALDPGRTSVRLRAAELLEQERRPAEALRHLELVWPHRPDDPAVLLCLARCRRQLGETDEAVRLLDALLAADPDHPAALAEKGGLALDGGRPEEAEPLLRRAIAGTPYDQPLTYNLHRCLEQLGKQDEAQNYAASLRRMDAARKRMGRLFSEVLQRPRDASLRHEAAMIFLSNGMPEEALIWLRIALELDPAHRPSHQALADYYEQRGDTELAARHRRAAEGGQP